MFVVKSVFETVKEIKQSFRLMMDGAVAQSMRDKGLNYHLNWGATIPRLQEKAEEIRLRVKGEGLRVQDPLELCSLSRREITKFKFQSSKFKARDRALEGERS